MAEQSTPIPISETPTTKPASNKPVSEVGYARENITTTFERMASEREFLRTGIRGDVVADPVVYDIISKYRWTLSKIQNRKDIPYIYLKEFNSNESIIQKQVNYYTQLLPGKMGAVAGTASSVEPLDIYKEIFPHTDTDSCHQYIFPYFAKNNLELTTPNWSQIEPAGDVAASGLSNLVGGAVSMRSGAEAGARVAEGMKAGLNILNNGVALAAGAQYPVVGALDRPRLFSQHSERNITISFPLFNTVESIEWKANQKFIHKIMNQNLMYKTSYVTGIPPVFYDVFIPGQYYCWASCVTNINVENLGNMRLIESTIVPDAYQVTITLTEMVLPSKNQFDARFTGEDASGKVNVTQTGAITQVGKDIVNYFSPQKPQ